MTQLTTRMKIIIAVDSTIRLHMRCRMPGPDTEYCAISVSIHGRDVPGKPLPQQPCTRSITGVLILMLCYGGTRNSIWNCWTSTIRRTSTFRSLP